MSDNATAHEAQAVAALRSEAREHKRLSGYHRRRAKELMVLAAGIEVVHYAKPREAKHNGQEAAT